MRGGPIASPGHARPAPVRRDEPDAQDAAGRHAVASGP